VEDKIPEAKEFLQKVATKELQGARIFLFN